MSVFGRCCSEVLTYYTAWKHFKFCDDDDVSTTINLNPLWQMRKWNTFGVCSVLTGMKNQYHPVSGGGVRCFVLEDKDKIHILPFIYRVGRNQRQIYGQKETHRDGNLTEKAQKCDFINRLFIALFFLNEQVSHRKSFHLDSERDSAHCGCALAEEEAGVLICSL